MGKTLSCDHLRRDNSCCSERERCKCCSDLQASPDLHQPIAGLEHVCESRLEQSITETVTTRSESSDSGVGVQEWYADKEELRRMLTKFVTSAMQGIEMLLLDGSKFYSCTVTMDRRLRGLTIKVDLEPEVYCVPFSHADTYKCEDVLTDFFPGLGLQDLDMDERRRGFVILHHMQDSEQTYCLFASDEKSRAQILKSLQVLQRYAILRKGRNGLLETEEKPPPPSPPASGN